MYSEGRTYSEDEACRSIFRQRLTTGQPWNHLCVLPKGHTQDHECWHGKSCATWDDSQSDGTAPFLGHHNRSGSNRSHELSRNKARVTAA